MSLVPLIQQLQEAYSLTILFDTGILIWALFAYHTTKHNNKIIKVFFGVSLSLLVLEILLWLAFFVRTGEAASTFIDGWSLGVGVTALYLSLLFFYSLADKRHLPERLLKLLGGVTVVLFFISFIPDIIVAGRDYRDELHAFNYVIVEGPLLKVYYVYGLLLNILCTYLFVRELFSKKSNRLIRSVGSALFLVIVSGSMTSIWLPLFFLLRDGSIHNFGAVGVDIFQIFSFMTGSVFTGVSAYAIARLKMFRAPFRPSQKNLTTVVFVLLCILHLLALSIVYDLRHLKLLHVSHVLGSIIYLVGLYTVVRYSMGKILKARFYNFYKLTPEEEKMKENAEPIDKYLRMLIEEFIVTVPVEKISLYLYDHVRQCYERRYPASKREVEIDHPIVRACKNVDPSIGYIPLTQDLMREKICSNCRYVIPLYNPHFERVLGFVLFSDVITEKPFSKEQEAFLVGYRDKATQIITSAVHLESVVKDVF